MIDKAVIPAAGLGTRLLPATKEQPKEMLPVYSRTPNGEVCLKPTLQLIHEQLYDLGLREFLMTRQGKRGDPGSLHARLLVRDPLAQHGAHASCRRLEAFYRRLDDSVISWIMQPEPLGFGALVNQCTQETCAIRSADGACAVGSCHPRSILALSAF